MSLGGVNTTQMLSAGRIIFVASRVLFKHVIASNSSKRSCSIAIIMHTSSQLPAELSRSHLCAATIARAQIFIAGACVCLIAGACV